MPDEKVLEQLGYSGAGDIVADISGLEILAELEAIRTSRIASSADLVTPGISSIGGAVADPGRGEVMGFCLSYPAAAVDDALRDRIVASVTSCAMEIGSKLRDPIWLT
jgi:DNA-binding IclR family transcriptional regulator